MWCLLLLLYILFLLQLYFLLLYLQLVYSVMLYTNCSVQLQYKLLQYKLEPDTVSMKTATVLHIRRANMVSHFTFCCLSQLH